MIFISFLNAGEIYACWGTSGGPVDVPGDWGVGVVAGWEAVGFSLVRRTGGEVTAFPVWVLRFHEMQVLK